MKKSKPSVSKLHKKLWTLFSKWIRLRDCGGNPGTECFTCLKWYEIGLLQAGHFISRRHKAILYDPRNVHAQCYNCNINLKGNTVLYYKRMIETYGQEVVDELTEKIFETKQFKPAELLEMIEEMKERVKELSA